MLSGAFYTLIGIKTKWLHVFLSSAYLFSLAVVVLIVYVMHPPISNAVQGAYFVAACVTGLIFGAVAVVFTDVTEGLGCFLGGFCLSMWFLVLKSGGIITSTAGKTIFIACFTVGTFSLYISHYTRPYGLIGSTSFAGATVVVLGVDMFSRAGLKEFWLYIWDLNEALFPLHYEGSYPITRGIRVEVACTVLLCLLGIMSQMKVWKLVKVRREQRAADQRRKDEERDQLEEDLGRRVEESNQRDRAMWDSVYGNKGKGKVSQVDSGIGTDEPSTRKGSVSAVDIRESTEGGMELQNLAASNGSQKGRITVHVAQDDFIVQLPFSSAQNSLKSAINSPREASIDESQAAAYGNTASETSSIKTSTIAHKKDPRTLIDPNLTLKPKYVPLPFTVPAESSQPDDDMTSVASLAALDQSPDFTSKKLSGSFLMRKLSGRPKRNSAVANSSEEVLVVPHADDDRASSVVATLDGVSILDNSSREALSSRDPSPVISEPKPGKAAVDAEQLLLKPEAPKKIRGVAGSAASQLSYADSDPALGYIEGLTDVKIPDAENTMKSMPAGSVKSNSTPEFTEQQPIEASLADKLPEGASKVVMAYRTNEWAKHLENAEIPEVEDIRVNKMPSPIPTAVNELSAPVNVQALQQTPLTAEPAPIRTSTNKYVDDRTLLPSSDRSSPAIRTNNPYFAKQQSPRESHSASSVNVATPKMDRKSSQTSLGSSNSPEDLSSRSPLPKSRVTPSLMAPTRGFRNSSSPMLGNPLAESPIEEGVESSFPTRFTPSPMHLMSQRDTILQNKPSSTSLLGRNTSACDKRVFSANSSNNILPTTGGFSTIHEGDDIPLSRRKSLLQQQQLPAQQQRTTSGNSNAYYTPATTPQNLTRNPSRISLGQVCPSEPPKLDNAVSAWRASLALDPSNTTTIAQNTEIEQRRMELLAEKRRTRDSQLKEEMAMDQRRNVVDQQMRRGSMMDAHREAMRKMQGEVNKTLSNGASY